MPKVVVTNPIFPQTRDILEGHCDLVVHDDPANAMPLERLIEASSDADAIMAFMTDCIDAGFLDACPHLRIVACALKGYDNFDVDACSARGVYVSIVSDLLTVPTAELAIGLLISASRHILTADRSIRAEGFEGWRARFYGSGLAGSRVGIIGFGAVGQAIAARLRGFDADVLVTDASDIDAARAAGVAASPALFDEIVETSDFIILATPLSDGTYHLIDAAAIRRMKPGCYLINPARGSIVDEAAVARALRDNHLSGYAADVFEMEDWALTARPAGIHPDILAQPDKTVLTPHIGSAVTEVRIEIERAAALSILDCLEGKTPRGTINADDITPAHRKHG
ncbi:MAG: NAD(P)-binding domain-containing protein [Rhodospirillales bacterium]|nr:NAD(P)-binding domain-containing protein [Rhodospirillales bacterium]MBO6788023.1 NAD(P)-binding domain-containing protein [Rhodospirillales bacterium]